MRTRSRGAIAQILLTTVALVGCATTDTSATPPRSTANTGTTAAPSGTSGPGAPVVTVRTFQFKPSPVTIRAGESVRWQNEDEITHEPTAGEPGAPANAFAAVTLDGKGSSGVVTLTTPGTYPYFCGFHESMRGQIIVT